MKIMSNKQLENKYIFPPIKGLRIELLESIGDTAESLRMMFLN